MNSNNKNISKKGKKTNISSIGVGVLSASVLAYCGYKIVNNQLSKTKYEPNPNKPIRK